MAHITGGGLLDNLPRSLPEGLGARIRRDAWPEPSIFGLLQRIGDDIAVTEMFQAFNMGLGMVLIVSPDQANAALEKLQAEGEKAYFVGEVADDTDGQVQIV